MKRAFVSRGAALALSGVLLFGAPAAAEMVLNRGNENEPDTLDPHLATGSWENRIVGDMILGLMTDDARGEPIYGAAEAHEVSADGLVYRFTIRDHVWSDGAPVTAHDFVFGARRILTPGFPSEYASLLYLYRNAFAVNTGEKPVEDLGVRAIDDRTLEITLEHPAPYLLQLLTHYTSFGVPRHVIEAHGREWTKPGTYAGNGPYMLAEWVPNTVVRLSKNPRFFDAANVAIDTVNFYPTDNAAAALKRFRAKELDMNVGFPSAQLEWLRENLSAELKIAPYINTRYLVFNTKRAPFDDIRVRKALSLAIDRDTIATRILRAGELPAWALVPPGMANYTGGAALEFKETPYPDRVAAARALLAEAGFSAANPLSLTFNFISDVDSRRMAVAIADMWKAIGVSVETLGQEKKVHYNQVRTFDYDVAEANWIADYNDAENYLYLLESTTGVMNMSQYADPRYDALMEEAARTIDAQARAALMEQAEQLMLDAHPIAPVFNGVSRNLVHTHVQGFQPNVVNVNRTRWLSRAAD